MTSRRDLGRGKRRAVAHDIDPENFFGNSRTRVSDRKTQQVCAQARQAISYSLSCDFSDELISNLYVADVQPYPDSSRLLVTVGNWEQDGRQEVLRRLERASGTLRAAVAQALNRKKAPTLAFEVAVMEVPDDE